MIDTHCHLTFPDFQDDRIPGGVPGVLDRAAGAGVHGCITISTTTANSAQCLALAQRHPNVFCSAGVHPLYADDGPHDWNLMLGVARSGRCVAFGELGLDKHHAEPDFAVQRTLLEQQLDVIAGSGIDKPIVLHCRKAFADLIPILKAGRLNPGRMVFHCFTGDVMDMRALLDFGALVSFTGALTYKSNTSTRDAARYCPLERVMFETDAPFLSPVPHRGKTPCEPWMASLVLADFAALRGIAPQEMEATAAATVQRFFGINEDALREAVRA